MIRRFIPYLLGICPKVNAVIWLGFETLTMMSQSSILTTIPWDSLSLSRCERKAKYTTRIKLILMRSEKKIIFLKLMQNYLLLFILNHIFFFISQNPEEECCYIVFNPLSWDRSEVVQVPKYGPEMSKRMKYPPSMSQIDCYGNELSMYYCYYIL